MTDRVALVTGACGWLGSAMSRAFAEAGARVVVTSRNAEQAEKFAATLPGTGHLGVGLMQSDTDGIPDFVSTIAKQMGRIDVLVNNAYGGTTPTIQNASVDDFDRSYHDGVTTYFLLAREIMLHLRERHAPGSIINIASINGVTGSYPKIYEGLAVVSPPNYHALKGALLQLTRHLAVYWAPYNIRVNAISPGHFPTPAIVAKSSEFVNRIQEMIPLGRTARPEEIKGVALLLASDAGSYITGQNLLVDGGWTAW